METAQVMPSQSIDVGVFDKNPEGYDVFQSAIFQKGAGETALFYQNFFEALKLDSAEKALEVGVGSGLTFDHYPSNIQLFGIDLSSNMIQKAKKRAESLKRAVMLQQGDATQLPYADQQFDRVVSSFVVGTLDRAAMAVQEAFRVCKPGGLLGFFDYHKSQNPMVTMDQQFLNETFRHGLHFQGKRVIAFNSLHDLNELFPEGQAEVVYDEWFERGVCLCFRATVVRKKLTTSQ